MLRELVDYYDQLRVKPNSPVEEPGWSKAKVTCTINLTSDGRIASVEKSIDKNGDIHSVPEQAKRASGILPFLLCDTSAYVVGMDKNGEVTKRSINCFEASKELHLNELSSVHSPVIDAVRAFYESWTPENTDTLDEETRDSLMNARFITFASKGMGAEDDPEFKKFWVERSQESTDPDAVYLPSLLSGKRLPVARLHPSVKGIRGGQSSGTSLVSFNSPAFESYGRDKGQGLNAPVGEQEAFAYGTALNYLVASPQHHLNLEDTTIVFWAKEKDEEFSQDFAVALNMDSLFEKKEDRANIDEEVRRVLEKVTQGHMAHDPDLDTPFFVLALAPNAARLSVRSFQCGTFGKMLTNIQRHYERIDICRPQWEVEFPGPIQLLTAVKPPHAKSGDKGWAALATRLLQSIIDDTPYPANLLQQVLAVVRSHPEQEVTRAQAALIKAYQIKNQKKEGVTVSLNEERKDVPYLLGRIFAVLENIQTAANPNLNTTIKSKYFNAYCATPARVFAALVKLSNSHLEVLKRSMPGLTVNLSKLLDELISELPDCPKRLDAEDQAELILGYYQQRQAFFTPKTSATDSQED